MSNTHRSDRVAVELMREINDILRLKIVTHVSKPSIFLTSKSQVTSVKRLFTIVFYQILHQIMKKLELVLKKPLVRLKVNWLSA